MSPVVGYLSGDRWLVAGDTAVVQLAGESSDAMRWWPAVRGGADAAAVIGQVHSDGVLGSRTPLAIVCIEPSTDVEPAAAAEPAAAESAAAAEPAAGRRVRVLVQGDATAVVETVAGQRVPVSGVDLLTWSEVLIEGAAVVYLQCDEPMPAAADLLPMPAGVVRAGVVRWQLAEMAATVAAPVRAVIPVDPDATQNVPDIDDEPGHDDHANPADDTSAGDDTSADHYDDEYDDDGEVQSEDSALLTAEDVPAPARHSPPPSMAADNRFPSISPPPFSPPPFVPVPTSLPPIRPANGSPAASASRAAPGGDHDGHTQLAADVGVDQQSSPPPAAGPGPGHGAGQVYAVLCPSGHANAPHSVSCRVCGAAIPAAEPVIAQRPLLGRIRLSTGPLVDINRRVVIGRAPSASRVTSSELPQLVTVPSPQQDISRSHVEVRAEDWHLVVADLNSTNGTVIRAPGRPEQLLHPGQAVVVQAGWTIDLGDGVSFVVERPT
ncbi:MAG: FHA domain-containing protein [Actinomycetota bacterium]|nr:FHA domain-containing protein [Actinomycetota bacterium]